MSVAVIAALPREIAGLVRGVKPEHKFKARGIHLYRLNGAVIVAAGMGSGRAALAVEAALQSGSDIHALVSTGLGGACVPSVQAGSVVIANIVIDVLTGERFATTDGELSYVLATAPQIASAGEKARLAEAYGAAVVDMEAATVGRLARAHGLAFRAIKAISDAHDFEMESLANFADQEGRFRTAAFALHTALRPKQWGQAMELGRNSNAALVALKQHLQAIIETA